MAIFSHHTNLRILALLAQLLRGINGKQQGLFFALIGAEFLVMELNDPRIIVPDDKIPSVRHGASPWDGVKKLND